MYINVWKSIAVLPSPSVQIADLWTPFTGFILIVRIFPTKRETKSDGMYGKKKSVIPAPHRRMRDRDKLVERRTGKLCWEIKLVIFVQCPALCWLRLSHQGTQTNLCVLCVSGCRGEKWFFWLQSPLPLQVSHCLSVWNLRIETTHLSTKTAFACTKGWSLCTGFTVHDQ